MQNADPLLLQRVDKSTCACRYVLGSCVRVRVYRLTPNRRKRHPHYQGAPGAPTRDIRIDWPESYHG